jgi:hypothetical protein
MREWMRRRLLAALACALVVLLGVAWVAGRQSLAGGPDQPASVDAVRLGPDPDQRVADYLAGLPARLPPAGAPAVPALAQFRAETDAVDAVRLLASARPAVTPVTAVFRVPLPRVQTALWFQPLPPVDGSDPVAGAERRFALAQAAAHRDARARADRLAGRPASVARYEATALAAPDCRCLLAVLVTGDRAGLTALAGLPEVRAVDAAPERTPPAGLALAPLLPEQTDVTAPTPDDGPVPVPASPG